MKFIGYTLLFAFVVLSGFKSIYQGENIEFSCMKMHKASNTCYFNFKVDGAKYRYTDIGCKFSKKQADLIKKAKDGSVALSKDWKIECPEPKEEKGL